QKIQSGEDEHSPTPAYKFVRPAAESIEERDIYRHLHDFQDAQRHENHNQEMYRARQLTGAGNANGQKLGNQPNCYVQVNCTSSAPREVGFAELVWLELAPWPE